MLELHINVDEVWRGLGKWGRYQKFQIGFTLLNHMQASLQLLSVVFIGYRPPFQCREIENVTQYTDRLAGNESYYIEYGKCSVDLIRNDTNGSFVFKEACPNGYTYSIPKDRTFVTEWDLVCEDTTYAELSQSLAMIGQAVGAATAAPLADRFGRKTINTLSHIGIFIIGLAIAFNPYYTGFAVLRFLVGIFQQGIVLSGTILRVEIVPKEGRFLTQILGSASWTTGSVLATPVAYALQNFSWRYYQLAITLYSTYSLVQYWIQDESVRWLLVNGKTEEAERIVRKAARWNKVKYEELIENVKKKMSETSDLIDGGRLITKDEHALRAKSDDEEITQSTNPPMSQSGSGEGMAKNNERSEFKVERYTILTLLKERRILIISLILWLTWITNTLTYFGLTLTSSSLAGNRFLNFFLILLMEYPARVTQYFTLNRIGRKCTCIMFHTIAGVSLIIASLLRYFGDTNSIIAVFSTIFTLLGKFGIAGSFSSLFLYTPELYPTNLRNAGIGFSSSASRLGGMLSPFASTLAMYAEWGPGAVFSGMCLIVSVLLLYLPETSGHVLPQTMEEVRVWYKEHTGTSRKSKRGKNRSHK